MVFKYGRDVICTKITYGRVFSFAVLFLFLLCGEGWSACRPYANSWLDYSGEASCANSCQSSPDGCEGPNCIYVSPSYSYPICQCNGYYCDTKEDFCTQNPSSPQCAIDTTVCNMYREECQRAKGVFNGSVNSGQCIATCDQCKELNRLVRLKQDQCCNQGLAPPDSVRRCTIEARQTPGMNWSTYTTSDNEFACQDPSLSDAASSRYVEMCYEQSSSSEGPSPGSSSSGEGGSSSGGGTSSAGNYGDCQECPWLDSILDTLTRTKKNTDDIVTCLTTPNLCAGLSIQFPDSIKTPVFAFDTAFRKYLKPLMDSSLKLDSNQLKALMKLDTNMLKQFRMDSVKLQNDTNTWRVVEGAGDQVDTSIHSMNDTTRKWFRRIADSIGVSTDSLAAHIDSIVRHIPDSILDSIVKYQQYATDNFDSVIYGTGKGFSLVDSLIDSTVKYFQKNSLDWQKYYSMYGDSTKIIHDELIDLPGRNASAIGSALGYGDTASTNLRGDLNGIKDAIEGLGDGIGAGVAGALDSAWGNGTAKGDSGYGGYGSDSSSYNGILVSAAGEGEGVADTVYDVEGDTCTTVDCFVAKQNVDSMGQAFNDGLDSTYDMIEDSSSAWFSSIRENLKFVDFDSVLIEPLKNIVPNLNSCPEECFKGHITTLKGMKDTEFDFGVCKNWTIGGIQINALLVVRLILRILTAVCCIYIGLWYVAGRK